MINRVLEAICATILAVTVLIAFTAVIFRYVLGSALSWSFEASIALLTYLTFIGCYLAMRKHSHLKVEVFVRMMPRAGQAAAFALNQLMIAGIGAVMLVHGIRQVWLYQGQKTLVMEIPVGVLYVAIPVSGLLMGLDALATLAAGVRRYRRGGPALPPDDAPGPVDI